MLAKKLRVRVCCALLVLLLSPLGAHAANKKPNIIFILADDFSMNLIEYMVKAPSGGLKRMMDEGATFNNFFVANSLCCPSRSTIFTGQYAHNTGVFTNTWAPKQGHSDGGFGAFMHNQDQKRTFALALHGAPTPYKTAMLGKYLNGYDPFSTTPFKIWGWDGWFVAGNGYPNFIYDLNQNNSVQHYGINADDYLTDKVSKLAQQFIKDNYTSGPFFVEIATFAPHEPYRPAYRDEAEYPGAKVPRTPRYNAIGTKAPDWMKDKPPLSQPEMDAMDDQFRLRAQSVRAIDKLIADVRALVHSLGEDNNTYIVFSADNGYHMGDHCWLPGKMTPFDTDINVPLVIVGPGITKKTVKEIVQNVDLAPTFADLAGSTVALTPDGHSLVPLLKGTVAGWRKVALVEHHGPPDDPSDPDHEHNERVSGGANPPDYAALRSADYMYVEYMNDGKTVSEQSYYDLNADPDEMHNKFDTLPAATKKTLHDLVDKNKTCGQSGKPTCWSAQQ
jgi:arylsulfatase A-like enzyme